MVLHLSSNIQHNHSWGGFDKQDYLEWFSSLLTKGYDLEKKEVVALLVVYPVLEMLGRCF